MDQLIESVGLFVKQEHILSPDAKVVIGLSGGADSVALLSILKECGYRCTAAHCNFHLRGEESERDQRHALTMASELGVNCETIDFDVASYISTRKRPTSVEMACRELRYRWFEKLRNKLGAEAVAVAHNADDNVETMLFNLIRGTGLSGVRAMLPLSKDHIARPLLHTSRVEIEAYLKRTGLGYVIDSTNLQPIYTRNRLRLHILAKLYQEFPSSRTGLQKSLDHLRQAEAFLHESVKYRMSRYMTNDGGIDINNLTKQEQQPAFLLFESLRHKGLTYSQAADLCEHPMRKNSRFPVAFGREYILSDGILHLIAPTAETKPSNFNELYEITAHPASRFHPSGNKYEAYFDSSILDNGKLTVRYWRHGDRIRPFGMSGTRAVSDIFNSARIPPHLRHSVPLLCLDDKDILWVTGLRASGLYSVTDKTIRYITVRYIGPKS